jgi:hypothetical protein
MSYHFQKIRRRKIGKTQAIMEHFATFTYFLIFILIIVHPFIVYRFLMKKNKVTFVKFILISLATSTFLCVISTWWICEGGNNLLLKNYGITEYAIGDTERYQNIKPENIKRAKEIYESMFGIGWPLRAIMTYKFYLPYLIFGYLVCYFIQKKTQKHDSIKEKKI